MARPCNWTYEQTTEVFNRVKKVFEVHDGRLEIIPEERYKEVFMIMANHFNPDEPLEKALGVKWCDIYEGVVLRYLRQNLSLMVVSEKTNEIIGVRISGVIKKTDEKPDIQSITDEPIRNLAYFIAQKDSEINLFERFGVDEAMRFWALGAHRHHRRLGLGTKLMGAAIALCRELGFKLIKGEGTSAFSQRIYQKYGFEVLCEFPYDQYTVDGQKLREKSVDEQTLREKTGVHDMTKIFALKL